MWLWLLMALFPINAASSLALAAPTSLGPTSDSEASILWSQGKANCEAGRFKDAVSPLQRLVDRYPGYTGYIEAHRLLGEAYLRTDKPKEALKALRYYVDALSSPEATAQAKLLLGETYLALHLFHEARLLASEFEKPPLVANPFLSAAGLLLKVNALMGLDRDASAIPIIQTMTLPDAPEYRDLKGRLYLAKLDLKIRECRKLPSPGKLDEAQTRLQLDHRGLCLHEAIVLFLNREQANPESDAYTDQARVRLESSFRGYAQACLNPPSPPPTHPEDRTPEQRKLYIEELVAILKEDCGKQLRSASSLIKTSPKDSAHSKKTHQLLSDLLQKTEAQLRGSNQK